MITLEYILIKGVNDDLKQAELLAEHAQRLNAKVNLIPIIEWTDSTGKDRIKSESMLFTKRLKEKKAPRVTLRMEKGHDIDAACGTATIKRNEKLVVFEKA